jgi:hypothetical protein
MKQKILFFTLRRKAKVFNSNSHGHVHGLRKAILFFTQKTEGFQFQ